MIPRHARSRILATSLTLALALLPLSTSARAEASDEDRRLELHGYGEIHYNNPETGTMDRSAPARVDVHRLVLGWEYEFTSDLRLEAEVDYEHAAGEIELEEAVLEYDLGASWSLRAGCLPMPIGPLNEFHEPPTYHSVERPYVETYVIPTTWQEIGVGVAGRGAGGALGYRVYLVSGLDAAGFETLRGIREGRQHGAEAKAEDVALTGRLEYATRGGFSIGASLYAGAAAQGDSALGDAAVGLLEFDGRFRRGGWDLRAMAVGIGIDDANAVSAAVGEPVGSSIAGGYVEVAYDLLHARSNQSAHPDRRLWLFGRVEGFDTTRETDAPDPRVPAADRTVFTSGLSYHPVQPVAFKADFEHWKDGADRTLNRFNLGVAFQF